MNFSAATPGPSPNDGLPDPDNRRAGLPGRGFAPQPWSGFSAFGWALTGMLVLVLIALVAVWAGAITAQESWAVWATAATFVGLVTQEALGRRARTAGLVAGLLAIPAVMLPMAGGGWASPAAAALLWPLVGCGAARLPLGVGVLASGLSAIVTLVLGPMVGGSGSQQAFASALPAGTGTFALSALALGGLAVLLLAAIVPVRQWVLESQAREDDAQWTARAALADAAQARAQAEGRSRFMAELSHEIRNPLNAILGFSETMRDEVFGPVSPAYRDYPHLINQSGRLLLDLISDLLDLSKIEAGRFQVSPSRLDLDEVARDSARMMGGAAQKAGVRLRFAAGPAVGAHADSRAMRQIALNLLSNAIKFTPKGGLIEIGAAASSIPDRVMLQVRDTGAGMSPEQLARIGEPYVSVADQPRDARGTGLGLALVKRLADLQGGQLLAESRQGAGTLITVLVPADPPATPVAAATSAPAPS